MRKKIKLQDEKLFDIPESRFENELLEKSPQIDGPSVHYYLAVDCICTETWVSSRGDELCSRCFPNPFKPLPKFDYVQCMADRLARRDSNDESGASTNSVRGQLYDANRVESEKANNDN